MEGFIVVVAEKHIEEEHLVFTSEDAALAVAKDLADYWLEQYGLSLEDCDTENYDSLLYHVDAEDCFRIYVKTQKID